MRTVQLIYWKKWVGFRLHSWGENYCGLFSFSILLGFWEIRVWKGKVRTPYRPIDEFVDWTEVINRIYKKNK